MIFRRKQAQSTAVADPQSPEEMFAEIGELTRVNRERRDPEIERRILLLRHRAGADLADPGAQPPPLPEADFDALPEADGPGLPVVRTDQLSPGLLRAGDPSPRLPADPRADRPRRRGRDRRPRSSAPSRLATRFSPVTAPVEGGYYEEFEPEPPVRPRGGAQLGHRRRRIWARRLPAADVRRARDARARRPARRDHATTSASARRSRSTSARCARSTPTAGVGWHQDGAFLGDGVRALNVWLSLSRCGDVAPGLDIVPRRLDDIVPTGTEGATFDWSVSDRRWPRRRPVRPGSCGRSSSRATCCSSTTCSCTRRRPTRRCRTPRYAIESWFFGPSGFPREYVPLALLGGRWTSSSVPRVTELRDRVREFIDAHVYPNEAEALRRSTTRSRSSPERAYPEILVEIRERARAEGLWNLFMPDSRARRRTHQLGVRGPLRGDGAQPGDRADGVQLLRARHRQRRDPRRARHRGAEGARGWRRCSTARSAPAFR